MQLIKTKCLPTLLYGLEACPLNSADKHSLEFVFKRSLMKLFNSVNNDIIKEFCEMFNLKSVNELITEKNVKFLTKFSFNENSLCIFAVSDLEHLT